MHGCTANTQDKSTQIHLKKPMRHYIIAFYDRLCAQDNKYKSSAGCLSAYYTQTHTDNINIKYCIVHIAPLHNINNNNNNLLLFAR